MSQRGGKQTSSFFFFFFRAFRGPCRVLLIYCADNSRTARSPACEEVVHVCTRDAETATDGHAYRRRSTADGDARGDTARV